MAKTEYDSMTYSELLRAVHAAHGVSGKKARRLHRALKRFGDGLPLWDRYPLLPMYISVLAFVVSALALLLLLPR